MIRVVSTSLTEARMVVVRSRTMVVSMPCGSTASRNGNCAGCDRRSRMIFAPGWRKMITDRPTVLPSMYPAVRIFCVGVDDVGDIGKANRGAVVIADDQRLVSVGVGDLVVGDDVGGQHRRWRSGPAAAWAFCRLSTDCTFGRVSPKLSSFVGSTSTRTEGVAPPPTIYLPHALNLRELLLPGWSRLRRRAW